MQLTCSEKKKIGLKVIDSRFKLGLKKLIHPILLLASSSKINFKIIKFYDKKKLDEIYSYDRPLIFVCNHTNSSDAPIAFNMIRKHAVLLAGKQPLNFEDELFFHLNSSIFIDRKDKEDMAISKDAMIETLKLGRNIMIFPEGTWNTQDATLMIPTKWGIIEVAQQANALIVPMGLDYDYDEKVCRCGFGEIIDPISLSKLDGINKLRDEIGTIIWEMIQNRKPVLRSEINIDAERAKIQAQIDAYPKLDYEYEKSVVYHPYPSQDEVFGPIRKLQKK